MKGSIRDYLHFFRWVFLTIIVLTAILSAGKGIRNLINGSGERQNILAPEQRVYDYGDVLTDEEEQELEKLIAKKQVQVRCDIVLVTLNESLKEYARGIEPTVPYDEFVRVYAEQFYEENNFGYDMPNGTGVLLVDNWFREDDGWIYTWLCTTGRAHETYTSFLINHTLDDVYKYVEKNPYRAYKTYVNDVARDMDESGIPFVRYIPVWTPMLFGLIAAVIFFFANWKSRSGAKTTTAATYINGGRARFVDRRDMFIRKSVVQRRIESNSGGGHGGGGHGGGGHRR